MNTLYYSPEALRDLDEIWTYIAQELQNPIAAGKTLSRILNNIEKLRDFAEIGPRLSSVTRIDSEYRYLVCGNYLAFYRINGKEISIDRILYGRRDYLRILFGELAEDLYDISQ